MTSTIEKLINQSEPSKPDKSKMHGDPNQANFIELNIQQLGQQGFIVNSDNYETVEQYRLIKRRMLKNYNLNAGSTVDYENIFLITSALQGDGKTFSAINLAFSIAMEVDKTVLLIDADVVKGGVSRTLGINSEKGFIDLLENNNTSFSDLVYKSSIPNLSILPAGKPRLHSTELFSSEKMKVICMELAKRYHDRIIIIDSPPLLQTTESQALTSLLDNIVFVVSSGHTPLASVKSALDLVDPDKNLQFILNKARFRSSGMYYYDKGY